MPAGTNITVILEKKTVTTIIPNLTESQRWDLSPQARKVFDHMRRTDGITAREAMGDYGMTSATLTRRVCDLERVGVVIERVKKEHPITETPYTRYRVAGNNPR